ncbi:hypothetical protein [Streptomyces platensis]|uniref:hypothetical protein n=1 Tax=Streptomyces platensis TaxID=58346 RepID=UPI00379A4D1F
MRAFLARRMLFESAELFTRVDVVKGAEIFKSFHDFGEATGFANSQKGVVVRECCSSA